MLTEGIATITADALAKDAPHPNAAKLFYRWSASEEGQKAYAAGGRLPPHPKGRNRWIIYVLLSSIRSAPRRLNSGQNTRRFGRKFSSCADTVDWPLLTREKIIVLGNPNLTKHFISGGFLNGGVSVGFINASLSCGLRSQRTCFYLVSG